MKPKNVTVWILLLGIVVLLMSTSVQAKELIEVNATDILEKIENGEDIFLKNANITGKLDLSKINLTTVPSAWSDELCFMYGLAKELKIVESNITIQDSIFQDDVDFSNIVFSKDIKFIGTSFPGNNDFFGAIFTRGADFKDANFTDNAYFKFANFTRGAVFEDAKFAGDAYFWYAKFAGVCDFWYANFTGDAYFGYADFGNAVFLGAKFAGDADFGNTDFAGDAFFTGAKFAGDANFNYTDFAYMADFSNANFTGNAFFRNTDFDEVSFRRTTFTNVSLIVDDLNQINVEWKTLKDALVADGYTYIKLIKNFREREQFEDADAAYYQYRRLSQADKEWSFSKLIDVVAGASCGYGVKPERPLIWAFGLIMVFTLVYWLGKGIKRLKENDGDKNRMSRWAAFYNAFYFSVVTFTTVGYGDWYPEDRYRIVVMIEGVLGWLLLALFIVTLANVMIRP